MEIKKFPKEIKDNIKYYVYLYIDPDTDEIFYVGKGQGDRVFSHLNDTNESEKTQKIKEIQGKGKQPKIEILIHGLGEEEAARVEASVIDLIGIDKLTNKVHGWRSSLYGRLTVEQLVQRYKNEKAEIEEPSILIRINRNFFYGMTPAELYDATRGSWLIGENREKAKFAFAVYGGVVQEVYTILSCYKAGQTFSTRDNTGVDNRWEFIGNVAPDEIREKYINKSVEHYFKPGAQSPFIYVGIKEKS